MLAVSASKGRLRCGAGLKEMRVPKRAGMKRAGTAQWPRVFQKAVCWKATRGGYGTAIDELFEDAVDGKGTCRGYVNLLVADKVRSAYINESPRYNGVKNEQQFKQSGQRPNIVRVAEEHPERQQHIVTPLQHNFLPPLDDT